MVSCGFFMSLSCKQVSPEAYMGNLALSQKHVCSGTVESLKTALFSRPFHEGFYNKRVHKAPVVLPAVMDGEVVGEQAV